MTQRLNTTGDMYELPNGAIISHNTTRYMKIKTEKTRYGNPENILVVNTETERVKEIRSPRSNQFVITDPNPVVFTGDETSVSRMEHVTTDKNRLQEYLNENCL